MSDLPAKVIDLSGQTFGHYKVIKYSHLDKQGAWWEVICSCGASKTLPAARLRHTKSPNCGCVHREKLRSEMESSNYPALWKRINTSYRNNAKQRGIKFNLGDDKITELVQQDCHYCKGPPSNVCYGGRKKDYYVLYNGIDRVDNELGYQLGNVVTCCKICNYAKRGMTENEFLIWAHRIARHTVEPPFEFNEIITHEAGRHPVIETVLEIY